MEGTGDQLRAWVVLRVSTVGIWGKGIPDRGNSQCKSLRAELYLMNSRDSKGAAGWRPA